jgi:hypothetical protein
VALASASLTIVASELVLERIFPERTIPADAPPEAYFGILGASAPDGEGSPQLRIPGTESPASKPAGTFRMVIVGESSSLGVPYRKELSFGGFYVAGMAAVDPERRIERVHMGENGRSSEGVVRYLGRALDAEADLVVVYCGHNEFIHRLTVPSPFGKARSFPWSWLPRIGDAIQEFHARGSRERTTKAVTALSEALSAELQMPLDLLERGDHERNPWSNFPVSERERELHRDRYQRNLEAMIAMASARRVPILFVRPTSNLRCDPLASGERFDPRASLAHAEAQRQLSAGADAKKAYLAARDLDPAPVRMPTAHREVFDAVMKKAGVPWIDGDACAVAAFGEPIPGDAEFVDFMHPRETVHAKIAEELARKLGSLGMPGIAPGDDGALAKFRAACDTWRAERGDAVAFGELEGGQWFVMMYMIFGNRAAAEARVKAWPAETRSLRLVFMLDLALRWGKKTEEADRELAAARARHPEWEPAFEVWRKALGRIR